MKGFATLFIMALIGYVTWQLFLVEGNGEHPDIGTKPADFERLTLSNETIRLSDLEGKKVILNFWATWCPPCKEEMPEIEKFHQEFGDEVVILSVNMTQSEPSLAKVQSFVSDHALTFPILLDKDGTVGEYFNVVPLPTSYFIDTKGVIREKHIGEMDFAYMKNKTEAMK